MNEKDHRIVRSALLMKIFPSLTLALFLFLITFLLSIFIISYGLLFVILSSLSVLSGIVTFLITTAGLRKDLSARMVTYQKGSVSSKTHKRDYEAGSATMPVTIFSILTPKIFKREMKEMNIYSVVIDNVKYELTKEDYDKAEEGKEIFIKRALYSNIFLGLEKQI